jgi:hypothetical protein
LVIVATHTRIALPPTRTIRNWTAIVVYFFLASAVSAASVLYGDDATAKRGTTTTMAKRRTTTTMAKRGSKTMTATTMTTRTATNTNTNTNTPMRLLASRLVATMFHVLTPMTLYIDIITWTVLVPALMKHPDLERRRHWESVMFSFISYAQHGLNAVIMFVELSLNNIPNSDAWAHGVVCLWNILFALWSLYFFVLTGEALYPFLDYTRHPAAVWAAFLALFASSIGSSLVVQKILRLRVHRGVCIGVERSG